MPLLLTKPGKIYEYITGFSYMNYMLLYMNEVKAQSNNGQL